MTRHPVRGAYSYADATIQCPTCKAEAYQPCITGAGHPKFIPCITRLVKRPNPESLEDNS